MSNRHRKTGIWLFGPLAVALSAAIAVPAAAQEPTALQKFLGSIGLLEIPGDPIVYRERAPLVVPPSPGLVPPRSAEDISKYNPDWPVDHEIRRRGAPVDPEVARKADEDFYSGRALLPGELSGGRISREEAARRAATKGSVEPVESAQRPLTPTQLGFKGWNIKQKDEQVVFTGEPERRSLTEPPPGLRTPSRDAPYGIVSNKPSGTAASTLYDRVDGSQNR
jgi:hypothetical protein